MDIKRSCSKAIMFWDAAQTVSSHVRWYFVDETHPFPPFGHRFSSENWDQTHWWNDGAGETDAQNQPYDKGAPPAPFEPDPLRTPGHAPCGPPEWWADGAPSDAPAEPWFNGLPECCAPGFRVYCCSCATATVNQIPPVPGCGFCLLCSGQWTLSCSDIGNHGCTNCTVMNGSNIVLSHVPAGMPDHGGVISNGCFFQSALIPGACPSGPYGTFPWFWELHYDFGTAQWYLSIREGLVTLALWTSIFPGPFNCFGPNTFLGPPTWAVSSCLSTANVTLLGA